MSRQTMLAVAAALTLVSACSRQSAPTQAEGAVAEVEGGGVGSGASSAAVETVGGGPANQTPPYGAPGGAPTSVVSGGDGANPSIGEDNRPSVAPNVTNRH